MFCRQTTRLCPTRLLRGLLFKALALCFAAALFIAVQPAYAASSLDTGFREMYNLDFAAAHKTFEDWQQLHPDDPLGAASNAAAYLFAEFERLQILRLDLFTDKKQLKDRNGLRPDLNTKAAFDRELAKADELAGRVLAEAPDDRDALFAKMLTDGLRGNYMA